jgi:hypothetical protein
MYKVWIVLAFLFSLSMNFAQENEYIFEVEGPRELDPVNRIHLKPGIIDTVFEKPQGSDQLIDVKKEVTIETQAISAANIRVIDQLDQLYPGYAKVGIGNYLMPLGEFYYNGTRSKEFHWGVEAKHHSAWAGKINDFAPPRFDRTAIDLYGKWIKKNFTASSKFNYTNLGVALFGTHDTIVTPDSLHHRFQNIGAFAEFASHEKDSAALNWRLGLSYNNFRDRAALGLGLNNDWRVRENNLGIRSHLKYKLGQELYLADVNFLYNNYKFGIPDAIAMGNIVGIEQGNTVININPRVVHRSNDEKLMWMAGLNLVFHAIDVTRVAVAPQGHIQYALFNNHLLPYASLNGFGARQSTFRGASMMNNFVRSDLELRNEVNDLNFKGGLRGSITEHVSFDVNFSSGRFRDKMLFILDTSLVRQNQFGIIFDDMIVSCFEGGLTFQTKEKLKIDLVGQLYSYQTKLQAYAWNLPNYAIRFRAHYNIFDKFVVNADLNILGGRKMKEFGPGDGISQTDVDFHSEMGLMADVNLSLEYRYNKRFSAFLEFNNLAAQQYLRWYNYPVYRFQVMGGVTFRF